MTPDKPPAGEHAHVTWACPFCGLVCDDIPLGTPSAGPACGKRQEELASLSRAQAAPSIEGKPVSLDPAITHAAQLLRAARAPLIGGLATDIAGMRALLPLALHTGATLDHMNSAAKMRNLSVLHDRGLITTTFAEVKHRADSIVVLGDAPESRFPRLWERLLQPTDGAFVQASERKVVVVRSSDCAWPGVQRLVCEKNALPYVAEALAALVRGRPVGALPAGAPSPEALATLALQLKQSRYSVIVWSASDLPERAAELTVSAIDALTRALNETTRAAALPLAGSEGDLSTDAVNVWQTGVPFRSARSDQGIDYDPYFRDAGRMLAAKEIDLLLWASTFSRRPPPATSTPLIVLGRPDIAFDQVPTVFIPVAVPGAHSGGHLMRSDKVIIIRLRPLHSSTLPSLTDICTQLMAELA